MACDEQLSFQMQRRNITLRLPHQGIGREMTLFTGKAYNKPTCEVPSHIEKHVWYIVDMQEFLTRWNDVGPPIKLFKKWKSLIVHILPDFIICGACKVWCLEFLGNKSGGLMMFRDLLVKGRKVKTGIAQVCLCRCREGAQTAYSVEESKWE